MINLSFKAAKEGFFDRAKVMKAIGAAKRRVLSRFGSFVRTRARSSIRKRKGISPPGGPPSSHVGHLKRLIFFSYDTDRGSVVIGPTLLRSGGTPTGPELLERGGSVSGQDRVIFVTKDVGRDAQGRFTSGGKRRIVAMGNLTYRARPFMGPAFEAEKPGLPAMWRDSVR